MQDGMAKIGGFSRRVHRHVASLAVVLFFLRAAPDCALNGSSFVKASDCLLVEAVLATVFAFVFCGTCAITSAHWTNSFFPWRPRMSNPGSEHGRCFELRLTLHFKKSIRKPRALWPSKGTRPTKKRPTCEKLCNWARNHVISITTSSAAS